MGFKIEYIKEHCNADFLNEDVFQDTIEHFLFDTRKLYFVHHSLFISYKGKSTDGHAYIQEAYSKGVRNFLVSDRIDISSYHNANFLLVENTNLAMQRLAIAHRGNFKIPVVGITGSTGKTSIKEWLYQLLTPEMKVIKNPRSYNSTIGVPLSILSWRDWHEIAVFEAGPAAIGDMDPLVKMIQPTIGLFSNIGDAHSANFDKRSQKIEEKLKLFKDVEQLIYCRDHQEIHQLVEAQKIPSFTWSTVNESEVFVKGKKLNREGYDLEIMFKKQSFSIYLPYRDQASLENAMHCICLLLYLNIPFNAIQGGVKRLSKINMRMEMKEGVKGCTILDDSYSADIDSFSIAMDFLERQSTKEKKTLVITDFVQSENVNKQLYPKIAKYINGSSVSKVITIGRDINEITGLLNNEIECFSFDSTRDLIESLWRDIYFEDEVILIKGARQFELNLLTEKLYERTHNTVLEVNMYGLAKNLKVYSELLQASTKMMVMVKASAYGAGAVEVAKMLEYNNVDYLAVAYADEGIHLRKYGIITPIMVLNPEIPQFDHYTQYNLEPEIYSLKMLRKLANYLRLNDVKLKIHLKIESGMNRLGFIEDDIKELIQLLKANKQIEIGSIFSHMSSSGEEDKDAFSHQQIVRFMRSYDEITEALGYKPIRHILNSAGIIRFPEYHFEMVRLGAGLYGIDSYLPFREKITTVLSFKSRISQIKSIRKGDSVGYSRGFIAPKDMKIAVVSAGFADGIPRSVSYGKYPLLVQGKEAPILGPVAMDMCMIDVTDIPNANEEDEVLIFGQDYPVGGLAAAAKTISYEIFTSISERVKRVYYY